MIDDERYMALALKEARKAAAQDEVPVGAVIVKDGVVIARAHNQKERNGCAVDHAEILAIRRAARKIGDWRLEDCTIYITLEPCPMCAGAIVQARIPRCVIGCMNPKAGCAGSVTNLLEMKGFNHQVEVTRGILEEECSEMLKAFFQELRVRDSERKRLKREEAAGME